MEHGLVVLHFLFPTNKQAAKAIHPRVLTTHRLARYPGIAAFSSFSSPRERK